METINLNNLSEIIVEGIFDRELDSDLRKKILDDYSEEQDKVASQVFHATRKEYFELGLKLGLKIWSDVKWEPNLNE